MGIAKAASIGSENEILDFEEVYETALAESTKVQENLGKLCRIAKGQYRPKEFTSM